MEDKFTWNVQMAGYDHGKADLKGEISHADFLKEFKSFPWMEQIDKAAKYPDKCSPTLSIKDLMTNKNFWISMAGSSSKNGYIVGYIYPKIKKGFLGFGKEKETNWLEMYAAENESIVTSCIDLFFNRNYESLEKAFVKMDDFGQMEAKNLAGS